MTNPPGRPAPDTRRPFRARDAAAAGISRRALVGSYRRVVRGVYVDAGVRDDPVVAARAALLVAGAGAFVSHETAARLHGGIVPASPDLHASVGGQRHRSRTEGVRVHVSTRTPVPFVGVPATTPVDTFLDLADGLDLVDLVILGDSLVRKGRTTREELVDAATTVRRGRRKAARAAGLVRAVVDSAMETRLRLLIVLAGLPEPEVCIEIRSPAGDLLRRIDMGYRSHRLGIEYDGRQHAESSYQYAVDVRRREELAGLDWHEWTAVGKDIHVTPGETLRRIVAVMRQRGMDVPALRGDWRAHFPGRS